MMVGRELPRSGGDNSDDGLRFSLPVVYRLPSYEELCEAFHPWPVLQEYRNITFERIEVCKNVSLVDRCVDFEIVQACRQAKSSEILSVMKSRGLRPALYQELLCGRRFSGQARVGLVVALGSIKVRDAIPPGRVSCLWCGERGIDLILDHFDQIWGRTTRFLAVRE